MLKAKRLEDILAHKELQDTEVLLVQEVRLHSSKRSWVRNIALKLGRRVLCSEPPEEFGNGMVKRGGTAIFWQPSLGQVRTIRSSSHSYVAIRSNLGTFGSGYGPSGVASGHWIEEAMDWIEEVAKDSTTGWAFGGDLNWRRSYADHLTEHQQLCEMIKPTSIVETQSSRLVTRSFKAEHLDSIPILGVPHHCLVTFNIEVTFTEAATTRLKRTAVYKDNAESIFLP